MKKGSIFIGIGIISGIILALFMKLMEMVTGNTAYYLLFDVSYIPLLNQLQPVWLIESLFHFCTCIISIAVLFYLLRLFHLEKSTAAYAVIIGIGSTALFFLTALSDKSPPVNDLSAWTYWVAGHLLFSLTAVFLIRRWY